MFEYLLWKLRYKAWWKIRTVAIISVKWQAISLFRKSFKRPFFLESSNFDNTQWRAMCSRSRHVATIFVVALIYRSLICGPFHRWTSYLAGVGSLERRISTPWFRTHFCLDARTFSHSIVDSVLCVCVREAIYTRRGPRKETSNGRSIGVAAGRNGDGKLNDSLRYVLASRVPRLPCKPKVNWLLCTPTTV